MRQVVVSAPGKIILMGEHAVVYGKPALLGAVNKRTRVTITENSKLQIPNSKQNQNTKYKIKKNLLIKEAVRVVEERLGKKVGGCRIEIESEIPVGRHLGSSAAVAVAAVGALLVWLDEDWDVELINELAYEVEKKQHKNPSGGDNTTVTYGGLIWFVRGEGWKRLNSRISTKLKPFWLVDTGKPSETTGEMVNYVNEEWRMKNGELQKILEDNEKCTEKMVEALREGNEKLLVGVIREGERTLEELGVVSEMGMGVARKIERLGGVAKILGGGGRKGAVGMMLAYHPEPSNLKIDLPVEQVGFEGEGVRRED